LNVLPARSGWWFMIRAKGNSSKACSLARYRPGAWNNLCSARCMRWICLIVSLIIGSLWYSVFKEAYIEYKLAPLEAQPVIAEVRRIPESCSGSNNYGIDVYYQEKPYYINISRENCLSGRFHVGDRVEMLYVTRFDHLFFPKVYARSIFIMWSVFSLLPLFFLVFAIKPSIFPASWGKPSKK
jgi:hypothetical protein